MWCERIRAKLTNIFSKYFHIEIGDNINNGKLYKQTWRENMHVREEPIITDYPKNSPNFVEVTYTMDFARFKYQEYPDEAFQLFAKHAADMCFTLKVPVVFNDLKFNPMTAKEYAKLYFGKDKVKKSILYLEWPNRTETVKKGNVDHATTKGVLPVMEVCAIDTPDESLKISFVNGMFTGRGGVHLEAAFKAVVSSVLKTVNEGTKKGKKKNTDKTPKLTVNDVKKHVSIIVNCWLENPKYNGNEKAELKSPIPKVEIDESILKPILNWELVARLYAELDAKMFRNASKSDGKKKRYLSGMDKLTDANKAGTSESVNCTLYLQKAIQLLPLDINSVLLFLIISVPDYIGLFPLKGKPLNVMNAPTLQISENKEINELKKIIGLREQVDYSINKNCEL